ncbi:MAG TPA: hypothetical protein VJ962_08295 [Clostridia bacterium]|nr:hypothetical protein [Clostridia bacterium]
MKKNKFIILTLGILLIFSSLVSFTATNDYITKSYSVNKSEINRNDTFTLTLTFSSNITAGDDADYMVITNDNFVAQDGLTKRKINTNPLEINLEYVGQSNTFTFDVFQNDGTKTGSETINIVEAQEYSSSGGSSSSRDTSSYLPVFQISEDYDQETLIAGDKVELEVPIENVGTHSGKNVTVTLDLTEGPFVRKNEISTTISRISKEAIESAEFNLEVSKLATNKVYRIPLTISGSNVFGDSAESVQGFYDVRIYNSNQSPEIGVYDMEFRGEISQDNAGIILDLKNFGTMKAYDVSVTMEGFSKDGIRLYQDIATKNILEIQGGKSEKEYFKITADKSLTSGTYELTAKIEYYDEEGNQYTKDVPVYVPLDGINASDIDLVVSNLTYDREITTGRDLNITFDLENKGAIDFEKVEIELDYPSQMISKTPKKIILEDFQSGTQSKGNYTILVDEKVSSDNYNFFVKVKAYPDASNSENFYTEEQYFGVFVKGGSEKGRPKLIVDNYSFEGENVLAGEEFPLKLFIKNTSDTQSVKNIKVSFSSADNVFMPVNASSSFFIDGIGSNQIHEKEIILKTKRDASVKSYNLTVKMEYEDSEGNAYDSEGMLYSESDDLSISVLQPIRLETSDIMLPNQFFVGTPANLEVEFYNMGRSSMNNMMVKAEGDFDLQNASYFKGTFQEGGNDYFSTTIIPTKEGPAEGKIIFSFEDAIGNVSEIEETFTINAMPAAEMPQNDFGPGGRPDMPNPNEMEDPNQGPNKLILIGLALLVGIIALVVFLKKRKKRKLKKLMEFDDIDDK